MHIRKTLSYYNFYSLIDNHHGWYIAGSCLNRFGKPPHKVIPQKVSAKLTNAIPLIRTVESTANINFTTRNHTLNRKVLGYSWDLVCIRTRPSGRMKHVTLIVMENHTSVKFDNIDGFISKNCIVTHRPQVPKGKKMQGLFK